MKIFSKTSCKFYAMRKLESLAAPKNSHSMEGKNEFEFIVKIL